MTTKNVQNTLAQWQTIYREEFNLTLDLSTLVIPEKQDGFDRLIVVAEGLTPNRVFDACHKRFKCWRYTENLDAITSNPDTSHMYAVWFRDRIEADEEMKDKSANMIQAEDVAAITLVERMLFELKYFTETSKHLDIRNITLCAGSRYPDGRVPYVDWSTNDEMSVDWYDPDYGSPRVRARVAVR